MDCEGGVKGLGGGIECDVLADWFVEFRLKGGGNK